MSRKLVEIASKFYRAHAAMKALLGEGFKAKAAEYIAIIRAVQKRTGTDEVGAAKTLFENLSDKDDSGIGRAMVLAATVEMLEGKGESHV